MLKKYMSKIKLFVGIASLTSLKLIVSMNFTSLSVLDIGVIASLIVMWGVFGRWAWRRYNG